jgi:tetratricopeptide (TPR) repeat protein
MSASSDELIERALQARREHRLDDAKCDLVEAVSICRQIGIKSELARALKGLGQIKRDQHNSETALGHYQEAVDIHRAEGSALQLAHTVRHVADILRELGRVEAAEPYYCEALNVYRGSQEALPLDVANTIRGLAILKQDGGDSEQSRVLWEEARDLYASVHVDAGVKESARRLSQLSKK